VGERSTLFHSSYLPGPLWKTWYESAKDWVGPIGIMDAQHPLAIGETSLVEMYVNYSKVERYLFGVSGYLETNTDANSSELRQGKLLIQQVVTEGMTTALKMVIN
jgi:hypothetical protein